MVGESLKILVFGATGMLGHKLVQVLSGRFELIGTVRGSSEIYAEHPLFRSIRIIGGVRAEEPEGARNALTLANPHVVVNCIGIIKQLPEAKDPLTSIVCNSLFPHQLACFCKAEGIRLIHLSTDCVFSGRKGNYTEEDPSDAEDLYGRTKFLGEVTGEGCLTLRTSIIGRELRGGHGLLEWFLRQRGGVVPGYARVVYSGLTTLVLARLIGDLIERHPTLSGVWQVSSEPTTKYQILKLINETFGMGITIERDESVLCDRSLNSTPFRLATGFRPPSWPEMIGELARDPTPYEEWRKFSG
ncbi:MAG: SDR family oxidoreductase [Chloroflexi bacterium]|nr:SDR family oxidoreductase [Chloroflexota bacterium]